MRAAVSLSKTAIERIDAAAKQRTLLKEALPFLRHSPVTWKPKDINWNMLTDPQSRLKVYIYIIYICIYIYIYIYLNI